MTPARWPGIMGPWTRRATAGSLSRPTKTCRGTSGPWWPPALDCESAASTGCPSSGTRCNGALGCGIGPDGCWHGWFDIRVHADALRRLHPDQPTAVPRTRRKRSPRCLAEPPVRWGSPTVTGRVRPKASAFRSCNGSLADEEAPRSTVRMSRACPTGRRQARTRLGIPREGGGILAFDTATLPPAS